MYTFLFRKVYNMPAFGNDVRTRVRVSRFWLASISFVDLRSMTVLFPCAVGKQSY